jgi:uncharacterized OB-fold protein
MCILAVDHGDDPVKERVSMPGLIPADAELFRLEDDEPVLLGSRCPQCKRSFFPRRWECPVCLCDADDVDLSREGTLYSYTVVHLPQFGSLRTDHTGGVGQVDLPEGVRIQALLDGDPGGFAVGQTFRLATVPLATERDGMTEVVFRFESV